MSPTNYLKCLNGVPVTVQRLPEHSPSHVWRHFDDAPPEDGITWMPFDIDEIPPNTARDVLVDGKVTVDATRKSTHDAAAAKVIARTVAIADAKTAGRAQENPALWTAAQRAIAFGEEPTDAELGI